MKITGRVKLHWSPIVIQIGSSGFASAAVEVNDEDGVD